MRRWFIAAAIVALLSLDACQHAPDPPTEDDPLIESDPCMVEPGAAYG